VAAVTTDIRTRRLDVVRIRHLAPVPSLPVCRVEPTVYRLRRAVAVVVVVGAVLLGWTGLRALGRSVGIIGAQAPVSHAAPVTVQVAPGDTFWSIASRIRPGSDPRPLVDRLVAAHGGAVLRTGERLAVNPD
jgi:hypothetical protein